MFARRMGPHGEVLAPFDTVFHSRRLRAIIRK